MTPHWGLAPFTNAPLKRLAAAGSSFFDHIYAQLATLLQIQTITKQNLVAPNDAFVDIYGQVHPVLDLHPTLL